MYTLYLQIKTNEKMRQLINRWSNVNIKKSNKMEERNADDDLLLRAILVRQNKRPKGADTKIASMRIGGCINCFLFLLFQNNSV